LTVKRETVDYVPPLGGKKNCSIEKREKRGKRGAGKGNITRSRRGGWNYLEGGEGLITPREKKRTLFWSLFYE